MGDAELAYVNEAFRQNWIAPAGPNIDGFETDLSRFLGDGNHTVALSSGTAALHMALILCGIGKGDSVLCQSMTFAASANPIVYLGAEPVFIDSESDTWNISPRFLERAIRDGIAKGRKPKAIIAVDLYGMPARMDEIAEIAHRYAIPVIEDAAEALGSSFDGQPCGTFGDFAALSFNGNKIITTSGGGALVCRDPHHADRCRFLATQARDDAPHYQHSQTGYNYRMSNVLAGIGRGQMIVLPDRVAARRANNAFYREAFADVEGITVHVEPDGRFYSNHWLTCLEIDPALTGGVTRETIRLALLAVGIESRPLWKPMHMQPVFEGCGFFGDGTSERLFDQGLCLPSGSNLSPEELEEITRIIMKTLNV